MVTTEYVYIQYMMYIVNNLQIGVVTSQDNKRIRVVTPQAYLRSNQNAQATLVKLPI